MKDGDPTAGLRLDIGLGHVDDGSTGFKISAEIGARPGQTIQHKN
jgi:hypothetical protein